jgi:RNA polymerase sigma-70 factor (ECF subfamily)
MAPSEPTARELFEVLVREHGDALLASIRANAGSEHTDDIFQDTVLVAWRRLADYDRTRPFGPWLRGIARLIALEYASRGRRVRVADPSTLDGIERGLAAFERFRGDAAEPALGFRERLSALEDCLSRLPAMYASTVQAAYRETRPLAEVALALGESEETVKKRLQRARALLEQCLLGKGAFGSDDAGAPA